MKQLFNYLTNMNDITRQSIIDAKITEHFIDTMLLNELDDNIVTEKGFGYVNENLQTHDVDLLCKYIQKRYNGQYKFINKFNNSTQYDFVTIVCNNQKQRQSLLNNVEFIQLIQFFNYSISARNFKFGDDEEFAITLEPIFAEDMTKMVRDNCDGVVWHVTTAANADDIQRVGLRCKQATYRDFPARIYLFATGNYKNNDLLKSELKTFITNDLNRKITDDTRIIKINLRVFTNTCSLYKYTAMRNEHAIYTYNNIPAKCIAGVYNAKKFLEI